MAVVMVPAAGRPPPRRDLCVTASAPGGPPSPERASPSSLLMSRPMPPPPPTGLETVSKRAPPSSSSSSSSRRRWASVCLGTCWAAALVCRRLAQVRAQPAGSNRAEGVWSIRNHLAAHGDGEGLGRRPAAGCHPAIDQEPCARGEQALVSGQGPVTFHSQVPPAEGRPTCYCAQEFGVEAARGQECGLDCDVSDLLACRRRGIDEDGRPIRPGSRSGWVESGHGDRSARDGGGQQLQPFRTGCLRLTHPVGPFLDGRGLGLKRGWPPRAARCRGPMRELPLARLP